MADNVTITPGTGATVAADDVDGKLHQRVKISVGADGTAADLAPGQAASAASLPVVIASDQTAVPVSDGGGVLTVDGAVTVSGTVTASGPLTDTQLRAAAVPVSDGGGVLTVDGTVAVTNANLTTIAGAVAGAEMQVDVVSSALPTGAATSANQTNGTQKTMLVDATGAEMDLFKSGDNYAVGGDHGLLTLGVSSEVPSKYRPIKVDAAGELQVDVLSSALPTGASTAANQTTIIGHVDGIEGSLTTIAGKDFATQTTLAALNAKLVTGTDIGDVTINNSTGAAAVNIQDGGNTITVDGTVAITSTDLGAVKTAVEIIDNAISGSEMQVDLVAPLPAGDNNIGNVDLASALPAGTNAIGATTDGGPAWASVFGVSGAAVVSADATSATAVTDAPTSGQKLVIVDIIASSDTAVSILFEEETTGTDIFKVFVPASGTVQITPRGKVKLATANKKLTAKTSAAGNVAFTVTYYSEA